MICEFVELPEVTCLVDLPLYKIVAIVNNVDSMGRRKCVRQSQPIRAPIEYSLAIQGPNSSKRIPSGMRGIGADVPTMWHL